MKKICGQLRKMIQFIRVTQLSWFHFSMRVVKAIDSEIFNIYKILKERKCEPSILYLVKLSFMCNDKEKFIWICKSLENKFYKIIIINTTTLTL